MKQHYVTTTNYNLLARALKTIELIIKFNKDFVHFAKYCSRQISAFTVCGDCSIRALEMHDCCIRVTAL